MSVVDSHFASSERLPRDLVLRQAAVIAGRADLIEVFDNLQELILIVNEHRQIVHANQAVVDFLRIVDRNVLIGQRPGEGLSCRNASVGNAPAGCGTSEFCASCGAVHTILSAMAGVDEVAECAITRADSGEALNLRVRSSRLRIGGETFIMLAVQDIGEEKRREEMERIFFHDLLNVAGALQGFSEILADVPAAGRERVQNHMLIGTRQLIDEITSYRLLIGAERGELVRDITRVPSIGFLEEVRDVFEAHELARGIAFRIDPSSDDQVVETDRVLLSRVMVNMIKNAAEATPKGGTVTLGCAAGDADIRFWVNNPAVIPRDLATNIFRRSFSTKGRGRGLGTYSMRLICERYLGGRVSFTSTKARGTTFFVALPIKASPPARS